MTTIEKIKAEIERQMKFYDEKEMKAWDDSEQGDEDALWYRGHRNMCAKLLSFLGTLEDGASEKPNNQMEIVNDLTSEVPTRAVQLPDGRLVTEKLAHQIESEKPMNLDFEQELYKRFGMIKDFTLGMRIAQAFYDIGCRRTAEKYDEIEYNRQRAEESEKPMNWEEELNRYLHEECSDDDEPGIYEIAEHFAQWGAEQQKEQDIRDMVMSDNRHFNKVYELGKKDMKRQMMKEAVEGEYGYFSNASKTILPSGELNLKEGEKVRIIIVKDNN